MKLKIFLMIILAAAPIHGVNAWNLLQHFKDNQESYTTNYLRSLAILNMSGALWSSYSYKDWICNPIHVGISLAGFALFCEATITPNGFNSFFYIDLAGVPRSDYSNQQKILKGSLITLATLSAGLAYEEYRSQAVSNYLASLQK